MLLKHVSPRKIHFSSFCCHHGPSSSFFLSCCLSCTRLKGFKDSLCLSMNTFLYIHLTSAGGIFFRGTNDHKHMACNVAEKLCPPSNWCCFLTEPIFAFKLVTFQTSPLSLSLKAIAHKNGVCVENSSVDGSLESQELPACLLVFACGWAAAKAICFQIPAWMCEMRVWK